MTVQTAAPITVFDALLASLQKAADYNRDDTVPPAAVLWPDEKREWERLVRAAPGGAASLLRSSAPTTPPTAPARRSGCGACWPGRFADAAGPAGTAPIIYLPGVSRATLRATEDCPHELKPLAELQYRGVFWSQANAKDWTISAFLQTEKGGLHLTVARDQATATSIRRAVEKLADVPVADLQAKSAAGELNSTYFDSARRATIWWTTCSPGCRIRRRRGAGGSRAAGKRLCSRCIADYGFDPARDGELVGAEKLGTQPKTVWKTAWKRFAAAPARYAGLVDTAPEGQAAPEGVVPVLPRRGILAPGQRGRGNRAAKGPARPAVRCRWPTARQDLARPWSSKHGPSAGMGVGEAEP